MRRGIQSELASIEAVDRFTRKEVKESVFTGLVDRIAERMKANIRRFNGRFPSDEAAGGVYNKFASVQKNTWGEGYWVGIYWLLYEMTKDDAFKETAYRYVQTFEQTLTHEHYDFTHCVGCEADPALVWGYRFTGDAYFKDLTIRAADIMMDRYVAHPGFMHMVGAMDDANPARRVIVDSFTVTPILYFATEFSGNPAYAEAAVRNGYTVLRYNVRNDGSIIQLTEFDSRDGRYVRHMPHQGSNLDSTWSRGSGWAAWGLPDLYRFTGDSEALFASEQVIRYFANRLPEDFIPFWDLNYMSGNDEPRDSSASALVSVGIQKLLAVDPNNASAGLYRHINDAILAALAESCWEDRDGIEGLLAHVCANRPRNRTLDDYTMWGDYYLVEALYYRLGGKLF